MSNKRVMQTVQATPSTGDGFGLTVKDFACSSIWSSRYGRQKKARKQCASLPLEVSSSGCVSLASGNEVCDSLVWNGASWTIAQPCSSGGGAVHTFFPIVGDGSVPSPIQISTAAVGGEGVYFVPSAWGIYQNPGSTTVTVGGTGAMYPTVRAAFAAGCSFIRVIGPFVTEAPWVFTGIGSTKPILLYIDMGATYELTGPVNLGSRDITIAGAGTSSTFQWDSDGSDPLFTTSSLSQSATFSDIKLINISGGPNNPIVDVVSFVVKMNNVTAVLPSGDFNFLGLSVADIILDTELSDVIITNSTGGSIIVGSTESRLKINGLVINGVSAISGTAMQTGLEMTGFSRVVNDGTTPELFVLNGSIDGFVNENQGISLTFGQGTFNNGLLGGLSLSEDFALCSTATLKTLNVVANNCLITNVSASEGITIGFESSADGTILSNSSTQGDLVLSQTIVATATANGTQIDGVTVVGVFSVAVATGGSANAQNCVFTNINCGSFVLGSLTGTGGAANISGCMISSLNSTGSIAIAFANSTGSIITAVDFSINNMFTNGNCSIAESSAGSVTFNGQLTNIQAGAYFSFGLSSATEDMTVSNTSLGVIRTGGNFQALLGDGDSSITGNRVTIFDVQAGGTSNFVAQTSASAFLSCSFLFVTNFRSPDANFFQCLGGSLTSNGSVISGVIVSGLVIGVLLSDQTLTVNSLTLSNLVVTSLVLCEANLTGSIQMNQLQLSNLAISSIGAIEAFNAYGGGLSSLGSNISNVTVSDAGSTVSLAIARGGDVGVDDMQISNFSCAGSITCFVAQTAANTMTANFLAISGFYSGVALVMAESLFAGALVSMLSANLTGVSCLGTVVLGSGSAGTVDLSRLHLSSVQSNNLVTFLSSTGAVITANSVQITDVQCSRWLSHIASSGIVTATSTSIMSLNTTLEAIMIESDTTGTVFVNNFVLSNSQIQNGLTFIVGTGFNDLTASACKISDSSFPSGVTFAAAGGAIVVTSLEPIFSNITVAGLFTLNAATILGSTVNTTGAKLTNSSFDQIQIGGSVTGTSTVDKLQLCNSSVLTSPASLFGNEVLVSNTKFLTNGFLLTIRGFSCVLSSVQVGQQGGAGSLITFSNAANLSTAMMCYQNSAAFGTNDPDRPQGGTVLADVNFFNW